MNLNKNLQSNNDLISEIHSLTSFKQNQVAVELLVTVAAHVKQIMKKRNWKVFKLTGPHDERFYKLLDELWTEYENLSEYEKHGTGFATAGNRLGGSSFNNPRKIAIEAAEKRAQLSSIMVPNGGKKLGISMGSSISDFQKFYTPSQLAALAAERRRNDDKQCSTNKDSNMEAVVEVKNPNPTFSTSSTTLNSNFNKRKSSFSTRNEISDNKRTKSETSQEPLGWKCKFCTFLNEPIKLCCEICLMKINQALDSKIFENATLFEENNFEDKFEIDNNYCEESNKEKKFFEKSNTDKDISK
ncbi:hypothetical protein HK099_004641 [Clydaea vesicula]|uniref:RanBP2-type domain-containing protein n=1 Tax=Clydaea vesicula TaxID=447962 RepID=A0AAD5XVH5_9FUNG|nr:hypothetical protein HK099_004641 [Clydaea vesicula]